MNCMNLTTLYYIKKNVKAIVTLQKRYIQRNVSPQKHLLPCDCTSFHNMNFCGEIRKILFFMYLFLGDFFFMLCFVLFVCACVHSVMCVCVLII